jgi:hypothetical protein
MPLILEDNTVKNADLKKTFGVLTFLKKHSVKERNEEGQATGEVLSTQVTLFSDAQQDNYNVKLPSTVNLDGIEWGDEVELTGAVTFRAWLNSTTSGTFTSNQTGWSISAGGIKKKGAHAPTPTPQGK